MTCKHEWIKHPNNELLEMCRLCDKERTKGKESQKIPDIALSKGEIVTESCSTKKCVGKECSSLPLKIFVGVLGFSVFAGGIAYGVYHKSVPEMQRCTSPKGLSPLQIKQAELYCRQNKAESIVYTDTSFGAIRSVWCVHEGNSRHSQTAIALNKGRIQERTPAKPRYYGDKLEQ